MLYRHLLPKQESFYSKGSKGRDGVESDIISFLGKGREFQEIGSTPSFCSYRVMAPAGGGLSLIMCYNQCVRRKGVNFSPLC